LPGRIVQASWLVHLCAACKRAFGKSRQAKDLRCPHCNRSESSIISRHHSAEEARDAVSLANVPAEIRDDLQTWQGKEKRRQAPVPVSDVDGGSVLATAADDNGELNLESVEISLLKHNSHIDAEAFIEQACAEGELLRAGENLWKLI
jgi:predicted  nucleic acid-binding Zn-ribbon protein